MYNLGYNKFALSPCNQTNYSITACKHMDNEVWAGLWTRRSLCKGSI